MSVTGCVEGMSCRSRVSTPTLPTGTSVNPQKPIHDIWRPVRYPIWDSPE